VDPSNEEEATLLVRLTLHDAKPFRGDSIRGVSNPDLKAGLTTLRVFKVAKSLPEYSRFKIRRNLSSSTSGKLLARRHKQ